MTFDWMETTQIHKVVQKWPSKTVQIVSTRWVLFLRENVQKIKRIVVANTYMDILTR